MLDTSASIGEAQAEDSDTSSDEYTQGQFVIIKYEGKPYVGQIVTINKEGLEINCMNQLGKMKNGFVWPKGRDCIFYKEQEVVCGIAEPQQGKRFATLTKCDWLMYNTV